MSVSGLGSSGASLAALMNQRRQSLQTMASDIQSGDVPGAQQALASLQTASNSIQASAPATSAINPYRSTLSTDLSAISSALQSGHTTQAQSALTTFQTDLRTGPGTSGVHHGHHHGGGGGTSGDNPFDSSEADALTASTQTNSTIGAGAASSTDDILSQLLSSLDSSTS